MDRISWRVLKRSVDQYLSNKVKKRGISETQVNYLDAFKNKRVLIKAVRGDEMN